MAQMITVDVFRIGNATQNNFDTAKKVVFPVQRILIEEFVEGSGGNDVKSKITLLDDKSENKVFYSNALFSVLATAANA